MNAVGAASLGGLLTIVVAVVALALFAPTTIGGPFSYAIVTGNSMSPSLAGDDIVLLRRTGNYGVGDIVAYRHPQIGTVLHRIVAYDGERFTTRGDNRAACGGLPARPGRRARPPVGRHPAGRARGARDSAPA